MPPPNTSRLSRTGPSSVTYHIPTAPSPIPSTALKTTIQLPAQSTWTSGLHWHNTSTEYLRLVRGSVFVTLGRETRIYSAKVGDGEDVVLKVERGVRHNWGRAEEHLKGKRRNFELKGAEIELGKAELNEEVIVEEWTDPSGISKPLFFWNLNGVVSAPPPTSLLGRILGEYWTPFQLFIIFYALDNYPVMVSLEGRSYSYLEGLEHAIEYMVTFAVLSMPSFVGRMLGIKAVSEERTPKMLWEAWLKEKDGKAKED